MHPHSHPNIQNHLSKLKSIVTGPKCNLRKLQLSFLSSTAITQAAWVTIISLWSAIWTDESTQGNLNDKKAPKRVNGATEAWPCVACSVHAHALGGTTGSFLYYVPPVRSFQSSWCHPSWNKQCWWEEVDTEWTQEVHSMGGVTWLTLIITNQAWFLTVLLWISCCFFTQSSLTLEACPKLKPEENTCVHSGSRSRSGRMPLGWKCKQSCSSSHSQILPSSAIAPYRSHYKPSLLAHPSSLTNLKSF